MAAGALQGCARVGLVVVMLVVVTVVVVVLCGCVHSTSTGCCGVLVADRLAEHVMERPRHMPNAFT